MQMYERLNDKSQWMELIGPRVFITWPLDILRYNQSKLVHTFPVRNISSVVDKYCLLNHAYHAKNFQIGDIVYAKYDLENEPWLGAIESTDIP